MEGVERQSKAILFPWTVLFLAVIQKWLELFHSSSSPRVRDSIRYNVSGMRLNWRFLGLGGRSCRALSDFPVLCFSPEIRALPTDVDRILCRSRMNFVSAMERHASSPAFYLLRHSGSSPSTQISPRLRSQEVMACLAHGALINSGFPEPRGSMTSLKSRLHVNLNSSASFFSYQRWSSVSPLHVGKSLAPSCWNSAVSVSNSSNGVLGVSASSSNENGNATGENC